MIYQDLVQWEAQLSDFEKTIQIEVGKREYIRNERRVLIQEKKELQKKEVLYEQVVGLFQQTAEFGREQAKGQIEDITTKCLQFVFERDIEFLIEFVERRGNIEADFYLSSYFDGVAIKTKPEISHGGGVVDILSLALRFAFLEHQDPPLDGPLFLDEPGKHVSDDYIFNLGEFIKQSSKMFQRQILMVTHNPHLAQICDKSFLVELRDGKSKVTENPTL